uniref:hypothetical protein n=1 Tax=Falsiroseomonas oryziterrae TaxID=2911368 RepID=UPI001F394FBC
MSAALAFAPDPSGPAPHRLHALFGAEIERPRLLRAADAGTPAALRAMLAAHQVILLRGAQLDAD